MERSGGRIVGSSGSVPLMRGGGGSSGYIMAAGLFALIMNRVL